MKKSKIIIFSFLVFLGIYLIFPYFIKIDIKKIPVSTVVYDNENNEIWEIVTGGKYRHKEIKINEIPEFLKKSIISIEDRRFYYHSWIDYIGILRALKNNILNNRIEWASTIENQLIRNNYWLNEKRLYKLKIKEFILALALDKKYSKDEILEMYLNNINFWYLNYWVASASRFYYNKDLNNLTNAEMLWLITIIKNSNKYNPIKNLSNFNKRFKILTNYLEKNWIISSKEKNEILEEKLNFYTWEKNKLPYIVDFIKKNIKNNPSKIITTIDLNLTKKIDELAKTSIKSLAWKNVSDYSIIVIDRNTLDLKVMIWWNDYYKENWQVNGSLALRQPGSALKPFIYLLAFQNLEKTPSSTILDLPVNYKTSDGNSYEPKNYSLDYTWEVTLAEALSQSINIPAVKLLNEVWINNFMKFLREIWITTLNKDADYYWLSLALWSWEVSLYELTRAYSIFAKWGDFCDINYINNKDLFIDFKSSKTQPIKDWDSNSSQLKNQKIKSLKSWCKKITDKKYTDMVEEILTNRYFKLVWFPINSNLDFPDREVFVKTGTSRNFRDNLSIWYTSDYIIWVWVGNKDWSEMKWVSWATWAWDIFRKIVYALDNKETKSNIVSLDKENKDYISITSPLDKSVFEINPSIPIENQDIKLSFSTNINYDSFIWYLNWEKIEKDFINIMKVKNQNKLEIHILKWSEIIWEHEVSFEKK